jgi:hypothetical protein
MGKKRTGRWGEPEKEKPVRKEIGRAKKEVLPGLEWVKRAGFQPVALTKFVLNPFALSLWFDRLTTIGFFPNVLSEVEGQAQDERSGSSQMKRETDSITHWKPGWTSNLTLKDDS